MEGDRRKAQMAVVAYALSKLLSKPHFQQSPRWGRYRKTILTLLRRAERTENPQVIKEIEEAIRDVDEADGIFVKNIVEKARAKMAMRAYSLGISISLAADLFGTTKEEVYSYVGQTKIHDEDTPRIGIKERLDALRRVLREGGK